MGIFDQITSALGGGQQGQSGQGGAGGQAGLMAGLMKMLNNPSVGGIGGLISKLKAGGMGNAVNSWISTGQNQPVSGQQVQSALGEEHVDQLAREAGVSREEASSGLASVLPGFIDKVTPNGHLPDDVSRAGAPGGSDLSALFNSFLGGNRH
jgi:uncharacterized protein YidB (DUF937 family)